jgi:hypothetical protein
MMMPNHFSLIDLNSDCEMVATCSLLMMGLNVIVLALFKSAPFTNSISAIDLVVKSIISVAISGDDILGGIESFWTNTSILAHSEQTVIITGHIESILCGFWGYEPALEDITEVIALSIGSCEGGSD